MWQSWRRTSLCHFRQHRRVSSRAIRRNSMEFMAKDTPFAIKMSQTGNPMAQIKIYGLKSMLNPIKAQLSDVIHGCVVEALKFPVDKRSYCFIMTRPKELVAEF
jgi:hypothetical protein